ncbi:thiamine-phosphate kinase [Marinobacterium rhizophilum]|uniref:Thiamine-monophosphate kinase n=1 Tax=Marinobacterium rhizophilum TaxID=420402 RepID=A0ABY5HGN1_9GAMM|nr:thiamine-phosphate kinase [Marinobacterium rhizophilum]UTW10457.1 thiamine-phosphate kinase [Marinobacterium rhizophilum]
MDEFALIRHYFSRLTDNDASIVVGIGDDCAQLRVPPGMDLVLSIDTLVEGTHFLPGTDPGRIASRLMGAAVSDLAAMGAEPAWFTLALTLPSADEPWLAAFAESLGACARRFGIRLVGGDTTRGPLTLSVQVQGLVPAGRGLHRGGAGVGDLVCVSGTLGDSRAGLDIQLRADIQPDPLPATSQRLLQRFFAPQPRLSTGLLIADYASSCIDISDGLLADLGHILRASAVGARIERHQLPLSEALRAYTGIEQARDWALSGGEDFELCFTVPAARWETLAAQLQHHDVPVSCVGEILPASAGLRLENDGAAVQTPGLDAGYNHFAPAGGT